MIAILMTLYASSSCDSSMEELQHMLMFGVTGKVSCFRTMVSLEIKMFPSISTVSTMACKNISSFSQDSTKWSEIQCCCWYWDSWKTDSMEDPNFC